MAHLKPIITLATGAVLAVVLLSWLAYTAGSGLLVTAAASSEAQAQDSGEAAADGAGDDQAEANADEDGAAEPDEPDEGEAAEEAEEPPGTAMAGTAEGPTDGAGEVAMAIALHKGRAEAYLCDGAELEMWLSGAGGGGELELDGADGVELRGSYDTEEAWGTLTTPEREVEFVLPWQLEPESGLYRAEETVDGARLVVGWIALDDGSIIGTRSLDGAVQAAPELDVARRTAEFDGSEIAVGRLGGDP